jgi:hypothetical protein
MDINMQALFPINFTATQLVEKMKRKKREAEFKSLIDLAVELTKLTIKERWESAERSIYGSTEDPLDRESLEAVAELVVTELIRRGFKAEIRHNIDGSLEYGKYRSSHSLKVYNPMPLEVETNKGQ